MKKIQFLLILIFLPLRIFANMASPWIDGSYHSSLYSIKNCSVINEKIVVKILKNEEGRFAHFKVTYHLISDVDKEVPLVFIGINLRPNYTVLVNNISVKELKIDLKSTSFIKNNLDKFEIKFTENESREIKPNDLIYFKAKLKKGQNTIEVSYNAEIFQNRFGFEKNYTLEYSLYPSKFWKSFENVEFTLEPANEISIKTSNIGNPTIKENAFVWQINNFDKDLKIEFTPNYNWFSKFYLTINPFGIALIFLLIFGFLHWKFLKNRREKYPKKYNWLVPIGILFVGIIFYTIYFFSFDFIDWVLQQNSKHGYYVLFIFFTMPFFFLFYGLLVWFADKTLKKKYNESEI